MIAQILHLIMLTEVKNSFLQSLRGLPEKPGLYRYVLPVGLTIQYLCIDHLVESQAGVFIVESVDDYFFENVRFLGSSTSRKQKKRLQRLLKRTRLWQNPKLCDISSDVDNLLKKATKEVIKYQDGVFEHNLNNYKDFVSSFSHEALTPIQSLRTSVELVRDNEDIPDDARATLTSASQSIDALRVSIEAMRLLFETRVKPLPNQFIEIDIRESVDRWCKIFQDKFADKNIQVHIEPRFPQWKVLAIPESIEVMVRNLISNGVKYSFNARKIPEGGKFIVKFDHKQSRLSFTNYGVPIPEDELSDGRLFERGIRGTSSKDRERIGKGVGLYLVKRVADLHNASLEASSTIKNPGSENEFAHTEFIVTFRNRRKGGLG